MEIASMNYSYLWITIMASLLPHSCSDDSHKLLLAVGGTHVLERQAPCRLVRAEPASAIHDLGWADALALETRGEGTAEVVCGTEKLVLESVAPARLEIEMSDGKPAKVPVQERFQVKARLYDRRGRELEVGKLTAFEWTPSGVLEVANDRSSGEFGFCATCFGKHAFRAVRPGTGAIKVRFGDLEATRTIESGS
jgi:hypothetical protein